MKSLLMFFGYFVPSLLAWQSGKGDFHREVFIDKFGTVWKYTEPCEMPQERHDKLYTSSSNSMDGEPEEPMADDLDYKILKG